MRKVQHYNLRLYILHVNTYLSTLDVIQPCKQHGHDLCKVLHKYRVGGARLTLLPQEDGPTML
jgi:hypothetical protein